MTKRTALTSALFFALAACSSTGSKPPTEIAKNSHCVDQTASRLSVDQSPCASFGRSYSEEDLRRTGRTNIAEALQTLDPSISAH
jgi:hypothetical protein